MPRKRLTREQKENIVAEVSHMVTANKAHSKWAACMLVAKKHRINAETIRKWTNLILDESKEKSKPIFIRNNEEIVQLELENQKLKMYIYKELINKIVSSL